MRARVAVIVTVWAVLVGAGLWMVTVAHDLAPQPAPPAAIWHGTVR